MPSTASQSSDSSPDTPAGDVRCPECGILASRKEAALAAPRHWSRVGPIVLAILVLVGVPTWQLFTPHSFQGNAGSYRPTVLETLYTPQRLEAIAEGDSTTPANQLTNQTLKCTRNWSDIPTPGRIAVGVTFVDLPTGRSELLSLGWPMTFCRLMRMGEFQNAFTKVGFNPPGKALESGGWYFGMGFSDSKVIRTLRSLVQGSVTIDPDPKTTGGWATEAVLKLGPLTIDCAICLLIVWAAGYFHRQWRRFRRASSPRRLSFPLAATAALLLLAMVCVISYSFSSTVFISPFQQQRGGSAGNPWLSEPTALPFLARDLEALAKVPDADKQLAASILHATKNISREACLAIGPVTEFKSDFRKVTETMYGSLFSICRVSHISAGPAAHFPFPPLATPSPGRWTFSLMACSYTSAGAADSTGEVSFTKYMLYPEHLSVCFFWAVLVWALFRTCTWLWSHGTSVRRRRNGRCIACGYSLANLPPAHPAR